MKNELWFLIPFAGGGGGGGARGFLGVWDVGKGILETTKGRQGKWWVNVAECSAMG